MQVLRKELKNRFEYQAKEVLEKDLVVRAVKDFSKNVDTITALFRAGFWGMCLNSL